MRKTDAVYERDERLFRSSHLSPSPTTTTVPAARERRDRWPQAHIVADIDYNMTGLVAGSAAGCAFMRWLVEDQGFGAHIPHLIGPRERAKGYRFRLHTYGSSWDVKRIRWLALGTATEVDDILGKNAVQTNVGFGVYTYPDDPAAHDISTRPISLKVTEDTFSQARGWMQKCLQTHDKCPKPEGFMPTRLVRLVDTPDGPNVRLYESKGLDDPVPYVSLSYCWGGPQPVTLRKENKATFLGGGMPLESLSKSVQDALKTGRGLGIHHLWVDSLCIIQDDPDDVAREIANMPRIYRGAQVTIKASRAKSSAQGFLGDRVETDPPHLAFKLRYRGSDRKKLGSIVLLSQEKEGVAEPLDDRAWALQERILSPRVLDFATRHVGWICRSSHWWTDGWRKEIDYNQKLREIKHDVFHQQFASDEELVKAAREDKGFSVIEQWRYLLEAYSRRELSVPKDRILAMSGIAETHGSVFRDQYLAGLWRFALQAELLWKNGYQSPLGPRPVEYQGPSWSWASMSCYLSYQPTLYIRDMYPGVFELVDYQCKLESDDAPYGAVKWGHLTVKARMRPALWMRSGIGDQLFNRGGELRMPGGKDQATGDKINGYMIPDALEEQFTRSEPLDYLPVQLLEVAHHGFPDQYKSRGLVLCHRKDGLYSRLGYFQVYHGREMFGDCEVQTVTIA